MKLRGYQEQCVDAVERGFGNFSKQLAVLPTGGGKTIVFSALASRRQPGRTLILAHRRELVDQAAKKLEASTGIRASVEMAEDRACLTAPVVVASVQSMLARLERWPQDHFSLVVCDESHHVLSDSWQRVLKHFDGWADVLGVTATPDRGDKRNLGQYFENVAFEVGLFDLVKAGYLSKISILPVPIQIDLAGVGSSAGDYDSDDLGHAIEPYLDEIACAIRDKAAFKRTLVFVPLKATSHKFVEACRRAGLTAEHVDGESPDRAEILARFANCEFEVLSNAMLLTEGYDDPGIECVVVLRLTRSRALYSQMIGRGTRICEGKNGLLVLDFLWMHEKHQLIRPAHLVARSDDEAEMMTREAFDRSAGGEKQEEFDLEGLASDVQAMREKKIREEIAKHKHKRGELIDAAEWAVKHGKASLADWEPSMGWESKELTEAQITALKRNHIDPDTVRGRGHAVQIIGEIMKGQRLVLASVAQRMRMKQCGVPNWETATAEDARKFFAGLRTRRAA